MMHNPMPDMTPHAPARRPLLWPDWVLDLQEVLLAQADVPPVYIVGGAVRDALRGQPVKDVDLTTQKGAIRLARIITNALDGDIFIMDEERGVARVFYRTPDGEQLTLDVADYRGETFSDDLIDRDFTINAMAVDFLGDMSLLVDPLNGEKDLFDGLLRRCHPQAITKDPIRALRGVRQSVQFNLRIEPQTLIDMRAQAASIPQTSPERVRDEVFGLLALERSHSAWRIARVVGILDVILPPMQTITGEAWNRTLNAIERLGDILLAISPRRTDNTAAVFDLGMMVMQFDRYRAEINGYVDELWPNNRSTRSLLLLAALLHGLNDEEQGIANVEACIEALRLSVPEKKRILACLQGAEHVLALDEASDLTVHRFWYQWGDAGLGAVLIALGLYRAHHSIEFQQAAWLELIDRTRSILAAYFDLHDEIVSPPTLVDGNDLIETFKLKRGPIIGQLLTLIREAQVTKQVQTAQEALDLAAVYLAQRAN